MHFDRSTLFAVDVDKLFAYHERPTALERLMPPNQNVRIVKRLECLDVGQQVLLEMQLAPLVKLHWLAEHTAYEPPALFADIQVYGPFHSWYHEHRFFTQGANHAILQDHVTYQISRFSLLEKILNRSIQRKLFSMFDYRHQVTKQDLELSELLQCTGKRIMLSGASGFLGQRISAIAQVLGLRVVELKRVKSLEELRRFPTSDAALASTKTPWHPETGTVRKEDWADVDAFVHIAAASIAGQRWTNSYKKVLRDSRVATTAKLVEFLMRENITPKSMTTASGAGIYPDSEDDVLTEETPHASDFLGELAHDWEAASKVIEQSGTRWTAARLAMVLDPKQGALVPLLRQFRSFVGGRVGDGKMYWSWIERDDAASAILWLSLKDECKGPFNISGQPVTNREFSQKLAGILHRPNLFPAPASVLRYVLGELADALLLRSNRVSNRKLLDSGYPLRFPRLEDALQHLLR